MDDIIVSIDVGLLVNASGWPADEEDVFTTPFTSREPHQLSYANLGTSCSTFTQVRMTSMISAASRSRVMQQRLRGSRRMHGTFPVYWIGRIWRALEGQQIKGAGAGLTTGCRNVNRFVLLSRSPTIDNHSWKQHINIGSSCVRQYSLELIVPQQRVKKLKRSFVVTTDLGTQFIHPRGRHNGDFEALPLVLQDL